MLRKVSKLISAVRKPAARRAIARSLIPPREETELRQSLASAYDWLCLAQDASPDDGVAAHYDARSGWSTSYPETTGYIIPTFLCFADQTGTAEARERAYRMAHWETRVQLESGAARSGLIGGPVGPAVFNTGQVLFGWAAVLAEQADGSIVGATRRAGRWLVENQDLDGAWRHHLSLATDSRVQTDNVRTAWGLALAGRVLEEAGWIEAAGRNADWALTQQRDSGWFDNCTFDRSRAPLLHTLAYTVEGLLGLGELLERQDLIRAAERGLEPIVGILREDRPLAGEYRDDWTSPVRWRCLTGEAQVAMILHRFHRLSIGGEDYPALAERILHGLARVQDLRGPHPETRGALAGAEPVWGRYGPFRYFNWGVKFLLDALLLGLHGVDPQPNRLAPAAPLHGDIGEPRA